MQITQITDDRLVRLGYRTGHRKRVDFQRPFGVCGAFCKPSSSPGSQRKRIFTLEGSLVSFTPLDLAYGGEGFAIAPFYLIAAAGFLPVRPVTSLVSASTISESLLTHAVDR